MTDPQDESSKAPIRIETTPQTGDPIGNLIRHPAVAGYLGKSIKIIALFAILGCVLLWGAITALSNIIGGALPK